MSPSRPKAISHGKVREGDSAHANVALGLSLAAVVTWLAGTAADELYMVMAVLAVAGIVLGVRAGRSAGPEAPRGGRALAAIILGGVLSALFLAFLIASIATGDL
jgi:hypothetical protein